jgi:hypothetical protein
MKHLLVALFAVLVSSSVYAELTLKFNRNPDGSQTILHEPREWTFAVKASNYSVFVDKSIVGSRQKNLEFHAITEFDTPEEYPQLPYKINRIYSYGVLSCEEAKLYLLADFFADSDNVIRYNQSHDFGTYVTNLDVPKSIAKDIYDVVCGDTI